MRHFTPNMSWEKKIAVFFAAIAILTILGPFGTYERLIVQQRFVYWSALTIGIGFFMVQFMAITMATPYLGKLRGVLRIGIGSALAAVPGTAILIFVKMVFEIDDATDMALVPLWAKITGIGWLYGTVEYLDWRTPVTQIPRRRTTLHKRLPTKLGDDIVSLTMQDHYVEVTTKQGKELILMRLRDAIDELNGMPGVQIHRSHWIAAEHLTKLTKSGNRQLAKLSDGRDLPVSATYLDATRAILDKSTAA